MIEKNNNNNNNNKYNKKINKNKINNCFSKSITKTTQNTKITHNENTNIYTHQGRHRTGLDSAPAPEP